MKRGTNHHAKTNRLMRLLQIPRYQAIGILESMWHFAQRMAPAGDIGKWSDDDISTEIDWDNRACILIDALVESGWLVRCRKHRLVIHDWHDHCDQTVQRWVERHDKYYASEHLQPVDDDGQLLLENYPLARGSGSGAGAGAGSSKKPADENPNGVYPRKITKQQVEALYDLYPRKAARGNALTAIRKAFSHVVERGTDDPLGFLTCAVHDYAKSPAGQKPVEGDKDVRPYPASWFNQERYDDDRDEWKRPNGSSTDRSPAAKSRGGSARIEAPPGKYDD